MNPDSASPQDSHPAGGETREVDRDPGHAAGHAELFEQVVEQVLDYAIIALDPQGTIETWNRGAERLKGYTAEEAIGRSFAMFYTDEDRRRGLPMSLLLEARDRGRVQHSGWRIRKDGSRFWGDVIITSLHDEHGKLAGFAKITRDRTDLKTLEDAQDSFYAAFDHDLRTPLTALSGYVDALRDTSPDQQEVLIQRVEANLDKLRQMIEGLLEYATRRDADQVMPVDDIDIARVVADAVRSLGPSLHPERVRLPDNAVALARANGVAVHRIVTNLLVNALRYSPVDTLVHVAYAGSPLGLELTVSDSGRGIDPADLDSIFDEFERGRLAEDDGGSGLGLSSVKKLVEQQGGTVTIQSEPGRGTTVTVRLPRSGS